MNNLYFGCTDCKEYIDAGYRWAYWKLEHKGIVTRGKLVSVPTVLNTSEFWAPSNEDVNENLSNEILPELRHFLEKHQHHSVKYGEDDSFFHDDWEGEYMNWIEVGANPELSPRSLVEVHGFTTWAQVVQFICAQSTVTFWWESGSLTDKARLKFEELVHAVTR